MAEAYFKESMLLTSSDRMGHIDVETTYRRVVGEHSVELVVRTRLLNDPNRSIAETERMVKEAAIAALQQGMS